MCFYHNTVLTNFHLLLISAPFHLRLIYMLLYQVLQIFDKGLSILAEMSCRIAAGLSKYHTNSPFWNSCVFIPSKLLFNSACDFRMVLLAASLNCDTFSVISNNLSIIEPPYFPHFVGLA